jgi:tetratricopeptide (TPR) repeat protein
MGRLYYLMGMYNHAAVYVRDALDLEPGHREAQVILGAVMIELEEFTKAESILNNCFETHFEPEALRILGYLYAKQGNRPFLRKSMKLMDDNQNKFENFDLAKSLIHFIIGEKEVCLTFLRDRVNRRGADIVALCVDPRWKSARNEPVFQDIIRQIRFSQTQLLLS